MSLNSLKRDKKNNLKRTNPDSDKSEFLKEKQETTEDRKSSAEPSKKDFPEEKATSSRKEKADTREEDRPVLGFPENHKTLGTSL